MFKSSSTSDNATQNAGQKATQKAAQEFRELPIEVVLPNPDQPRRQFDQQALQALAGSIRERGVLQPVLVRPLKDGKYELVAGERRWRAAKLAGLQSIPALVSRYDDAAALEVGLIENMARKDLNPVEEARACMTLSKELGLTHPQIADRVGRHRSVVSNLVRLLNLSREILAFVERGELRWGHGIALLKAEDLQARHQLACAAIEEGWSVRELEGRARASNMNPSRTGGTKEQGSKEQGSDQGQAQDPEQGRDLAALNLARAWGDLLGSEVHIRMLPRGQMRMEVVFDFAAEGIALADRLTSVTSR